MTSKSQTTFQLIRVRYSTLRGDPYLFSIWTGMNADGVFMTYFSTGGRCATRHDHQDRPRETSSLTREDSTLSSQRIFLLGRVWPHQTFTITSEGSAHALPFLPYLLMIALGQYALRPVPSSSAGRSREIALAPCTGFFSGSTTTSSGAYSRSRRSRWSAA